MGDVSNELVKRDVDQLGPAEKSEAVGAGTRQLLVSR
jgi:hypothetical protein